MAREGKGHWKHRMREMNRTWLKTSTLLSLTMEVYKEPKEQHQEDTGVRIQGVHDPARPPLLEGSDVASYLSPDAFLHLSRKGKLQFVSFSNLEVKVTLVI